MSAKGKRIGALCSLLLLLTGCTSQVPDTVPTAPIQAEADLFAMDTFMTMKAYGPGADALLAEAKIRIRTLEHSLSVTEPDSDIGKLNRAGGQSVTVTADTTAILETAITLGNLTNGALDVSIYPLVAAWGFTTGQNQIPSPDTIADLLPHVDYTKIQLTDDTVTLPTDMQIDLGSLAKGYTGDVVAKLLREGGVTSALLNLGGNVHTIGAKTDGTPWKVAIADPFAPENNMMVLAVTDAVVITSGNYERYFIGEDGVRYCHILDSQTGYPADNGIVSMTIVGDSTRDDCGLRCDGLSTALYVSGSDRAKEIWQSCGDFDMVYVTEDGQIYITEGLAGQYTNVSAMPVEVLYAEAE